MKLLVLLKAFGFAATVHAASVSVSSTPNLPRVLVAEVNGVYRPLSLSPHHSNLESDSELHFPEKHRLPPLIWGNPVAPPLELVLKDGELSSSNYIENGYVYDVYDEIIGFASNTLSPGIIEEKKLSEIWDFSYFTCPRPFKLKGSNKTEIYNVVKTIPDSCGWKCNRAILHYLPFDKVTRKVINVDYGNDNKTMAALKAYGNVAKDPTALTVVDRPLAFFIKINDTWSPITIEYSGRCQSTYAFLYDVPSQYPIEFKFNGTRNRLVSSNRDVKEWNACFEGAEPRFEGAESLAGIQRDFCVKPITLDNKNKVVGQKVLVSKADKYLYIKEAKGREAVDIYLFYFDRKTNQPLLNEPV